MFEDNIWNEMKRMRRKMNKIFGSNDFNTRSFPEEPENYRQAWADFSEEDEKYTITLELPGIDKENIKIEISDNYLIIKAENKKEVEEKDDDNYKYSKSYDGFYRTVHLPDNANSENINAKLEKGILKITLQKKRLQKRRW